MEDDVEEASVVDKGESENSCEEEKGEESDDNNAVVEPEPIEQGPTIRLKTMTKIRPYEGRKKLPVRKENMVEGSGSGQSRGEGGSAPSATKSVSVGLPEGVPTVHDIDDGYNSEELESGDSSGGSDAEGSRPHYISQKLL
ncbi:putative G-protein coupled receptor [Sesbania bispinosa]|nr:putative G-protein coupled receptor [Sesbania bispinosa]